MYRLTEPGKNARLDHFTGIDKFPIKQVNIMKKQTNNVNTERKKTENVVNYYLEENRLMKNGPCLLEFLKSKYRTVNVTEITKIWKL